MPETEIKTLRTDFAIKAVLPEQRIIEGFAAMGGNLDRVRDVIDRAANVKAAQTPLDEVGVFIGHQSADLPIGRCIELRAVGDGLHSKTYIFPTSRGDDLLQTARALQDAGSALGMSIGYRTDDFSYQQRDGKTVRVIKSYQLAEYSFAARQMIANPAALVTGVKTLNEYSRDELEAALAEFDSKAAGGMGADMPYEIRKHGDQFCVHNQQTGKQVACHPSEAEAMAQMRALYANVPDARGKMVSMNDLPDSAFLYIEPGGARDEEGKTVPRSLRHLAYRDADGAITLDQVQAALTALPDLTADDLDREAKTVLGARLRRMVDQMLATKTADAAAPEWQHGAAIQVRAIGYGLLDISETIAGELKAMALLGSDTKDNGRLRTELRQKLADLAGELSRLVEHAELIDREQDGAAKIAHYRRTLELLEV